VKLAGLPVIALGTGQARRHAPRPGTPCVAIVSGTRIVCIAFPAPKRLRGGALERVAFHALQDRLASPMTDTVRVAVRETPGDTALAFVAAADEVSAWLSEAKAAGWQPAALLPDWLALPWCAGLWSLHAAGDMIIARTGRLTGFTAETPLATAILGRRLAEAAPRAVLLTGDATATATLKGLLADKAVPLHTDPAGPGAHRFAAQEAAASLGGHATSPLATMATATRPWAAPAALALVAFTAWCTTALLDIRRDLEVAESHAAQATAAFRAIHGNGVPIVDMRLQTARHLDRLRAGHGQSAVDHAFGPLLATAEEGLSSVRVHSIGWRERTGLTAEISVGDFAALEVLVARLRDAGLDVDIARADARGGAGVDAALALAFAGGTP
jgi:general secretion pathway protein L